VLLLRRITLKYVIYKRMRIPGAAAADVLIGSRTTETCGSPPPLARSFLRFSVSAVRVLYTHRIHMYGIHGTMPPHLLYLYAIMLFFRTERHFIFLFDNRTPSHLGASWRGRVQRKQRLYIRRPTPPPHTQTRTHIR